MDPEAKFLNMYINTLTEQVKQLTMDKTLLTVRLTLANEQIEEMKKQHVSVPQYSSEQQPS